jgi:hypothetical protein
LRCSASALRTSPKRANIDVTKTYTNAFVDAAAKTSDAAK